MWGGLPWVWMKGSFLLLLLLLLLLLCLSPSLSLSLSLRGDLGLDEEQLAARHLKGEGVCVCVSRGGEVGRRDGGWGGFCVSVMAKWAVWRTCQTAHLPADTRPALQMRPAAHEIVQRERDGARRGAECGRHGAPAGAAQAGPNGGGG